MNKNNSISFIPNHTPDISSNFKNLKLKRTIDNRIDLINFDKNVRKKSIT